MTVIDALILTIVLACPVSLMLDGVINIPKGYVLCMLLNKTKYNY